jgi:hypothetical protein
MPISRCVEADIFIARFYYSARINTNARHEPSGSLPTYFDFFLAFPLEPFDFATMM